MIEMSFRVGVPVGIVRVYYKYCECVLIRCRSDAVKVNLILLFAKKFVIADLKVLEDGTD